MTGIAGEFGAIAVVGAGAYGAALALAAARAGRRVVLWARDATTVATIATTRMAPRLPGVALPDSILATGALDAVAAADAILVTVPTQSLRQVCAALAGVLPAGLPVISAAKGIEQTTGLFTTQVIAQACPGARPAIPRARALPPISPGACRPR